MQWARQPTRGQQPTRGAPKPAWSSPSLVPGNLHDALDHLEILNDRLVHKHIRPGSDGTGGWTWEKVCSRFCCFAGLSMCLALVIMVTSDISQMTKFAPDLGEVGKDVFGDVPNVDIDFTLGGANSEPPSVFEASEPPSVFGASPAGEAGSDIPQFKALGPQEELDNNPPEKKEPGMTLLSPANGKVYMPQVVYPGQKLNERNLPDPLISSLVPPEPEKADLIGRGIDALNAKVIRPTPRVEPFWRGRAATLGGELRAKGSKIKALFLGDDTVETWAGFKNGEPCGKFCGHVRTLFQTNFPDADGNLASAITDDRSENLVWRIYQEGVASLNPYVVVIYIGQADLTAGKDPVDVAAGIQACLKALNFFLPATEFLLVGLLPRADDVHAAIPHPSPPPPFVMSRGDSRRKKKGKMEIPEVPLAGSQPLVSSISFAESSYFSKIRMVNDWLQVLANNADTVHYLDCGLQFLVPGPTSEIEVSARLMPDFLHLNDKGHQKFLSCVHDTVEHLVMKAKSKLNQAPIGKK